MRWTYVPIENNTKLESWSLPNFWSSSSHIWCCNCLAEIMNDMLGLITKNNVAAPSVLMGSEEAYFEDTINPALTDTLHWSAESILGPTELMN